MRQIIACLWILILSSSAYAFFGNYSLYYSTGENFQDGEKVSDFSNFNQNYFFTGEQPITPALSLAWSLNTSFQNQEFSSAGLDSETNTRMIAPALDLRLHNPFYELNGGVQLQEYELDSGSQNTTLIYTTFGSRFGPKYPSLHLEFSRNETSNEFNTDNTESTTTSYLLGSDYRFVYRRIQSDILFTYAHAIAETPGQQISESTADDYNLIYRAGYNNTFWNKRIFVSAGYEGIWSRNVTEQVISETGDIVFKRRAVQGLHTLGTLAEPSPETLSSEAALIDGNRTAGIGSINIGSGRFHNIGVGINPLDLGKTIDRIYVYVKPAPGMDLQTDQNLLLPTNWTVFSTQDSIVTDPGIPVTWSNINISRINLVEVDRSNNVLRYELVFSSSRVDQRFYKVVNLETVNVLLFPGASVLVTEIEALGIEVVSEDGTLKSEGSSMSQGLNLQANYRPRKNLYLNVNFTINRTDGDPDALFLGKLLYSSVSKDLDRDEGATVSRSYGSYLTWTANRYLTTTARIGRSENFNSDGFDGSSNYYMLGFASSPLPTLDLYLSLRRNDNFSDSEKQSTSDSATLNTSARIYNEVHMTMEFHIAKGENLTNNTDYTVRSVTGNMDIRITRALVTYMGFGFQDRESGGTDTKTKQAFVNVNYRPVKFFNLNAMTTYADTDGSDTSYTVFSASWLALPGLTLNANYATNNSSMLGSAILNLSRRLNLKITGGHSEFTGNNKTESNFVTFELSGIII